VFLVGKLVHSFAIALSTNLLMAFAGRVSMSIAANSLGKCKGDQSGTLQEIP